MNKSKRDRGRKRPADAEMLMAQVSDEFTKKKKLLGAQKAAEELDVCLASFYNYLNKKAVPDLEVLRRANQKWNIEWKHFDFSQIMQKQAVKSPEQLALRFIEAVREEDIEVSEARPVAKNVLKVALKIRFSA